MVQQLSNCFCYLFSPYTSFMCECVTGYRVSGVYCVIVKMQTFFIGWLGLVTVSHKAGLLCSCVQCCFQRNVSKCVFVILYGCMRYQLIVVTCDFWVNKQYICVYMYKYIFQYSVIFMRSLIYEVVLCMMWLASLCVYILP